MQETINLSGLLTDFMLVGPFPETSDQLSTWFVATLIAVEVIFFSLSLLALYRALRHIGWPKRLMYKIKDQDPSNKAYGYVKQYY